MGASNNQCFPIKVFCFGNCDDILQSIFTTKVETNNSEYVDDVTENSETKILTNEEMYEGIIKDYKGAISEFNFEDMDIEEKLQNKYDMVSMTLIEHVYRYKENGVKLTYNFYDIDKNGVDELLVGADNSIGAIYSYDSNNNEPKQIIFQDTMERGNLVVYDNGVILSEGSGGAALHYYKFGKISEDGVSYSLLETIEEEYVEGRETPIYRDNDTRNVLDYKGIDEIMDKYVHNAEVFDNSNCKEI